MFYVSDEPEGKFFYTETTKLYCIVLYCNDVAQYFSASINALRKLYQ